jgi:hypothetical protein
MIRIRNYCHSDLVLRRTYSSSVTFQYASLTNLDQLSIRAPCDA